MIDREAPASADGKQRTEQCEGWIRFPSMTQKKTAPVRHAGLAGVGQCAAIEKGHSTRIDNGALRDID